MKYAISSPASGLPWSGLNSISSVSSTSRMVSTSPVPSDSPFPPLPLPDVSPRPSLRNVATSSRKEPDATEAGYCFAKLLSPSMAARRSSSNVADCSRPQSVSMVAVAVCKGGVLSIVILCCPPACASSFHCYSRPMPAYFLSIQQPAHATNASVVQERVLHLLQYEVDP